MTESERHYDLIDEGLPGKLELLGRQRLNPCRFVFLRRASVD
jgi:hypothetical protein